MAQARKTEQPLEKRPLSREVLKDFLERWGVRDYLFDPESGAFFFAVLQDGSRFTFHLRLFGKEKRFFLAAVRFVVEGAPPKGKRERFFSEMARLNYGLLLGRLGWDEKTGEVACDFVSPVNGGLAFDDFSLIMSGLLSAASEAQKALKPLAGPAAGQASTAEPENVSASSEPKTPAPRTSGTVAGGKTGAKPPAGKPSETRKGPAAPGSGPPEKGAEDPAGQAER